MTFSKNITNWYSVHKRDLPWRNTKDPYIIWLSEIILQQTQIKQGLPYFKTFTSNFPTIYDLANADEDTVLKLWQGLGYYSRARNLHITSKHIVTTFNGEFPNSYKELIKLKGIGDYTASAIASISFNEACAVVDGNVYRVLARYFGIPTAINTNKGAKEFKKLAQELLPKTNFGDYNQGIMEFGAKQCKPANPNCLACPLNKSCVALKKGLIKLLPKKEGKIKISNKFFNFMVFISEDGKTLIEQRINKGIWHKLYQFPLLESQDSLKSIDSDTLKKNYSFVNSKRDKAYLYNDQEIIHKLSHQKLHCKFWIIPVNKLPKEAIKINSIESFPVPVIIEKFLKEFNFESLTIN